MADVSTKKTRAMIINVPGPDSGFFLAMTGHSSFGNGGRDRFRPPRCAWGIGFTLTAGAGSCNDNGRPRAAGRPPSRGRAGRTGVGDCAGFARCFDRPGAGRYDAPTERET